MQKEEIVTNNIMISVWVDEIGEFRKYTKRELALKKFAEINNINRIANLMGFIKNSLVADEILQIFNQVNWVSARTIIQLTGFSRNRVYNVLNKLYDFGLIKYTYNNGGFLSRYDTKVWSLI